MKRKRILTASIMTLMLATATGCSNGQNAENQNTMFSVENDADENAVAPSEGNATEHNTPEISTSDNQDDTSGNKTDISPDTNSDNHDSVYISGHVRNTAQDSFPHSKFGDILMEMSL